jgi:hypothetical protein
VLPAQLVELRDQSVVFLLMGHVVAIVCLLHQSFFQCEVGLGVAQQRIQYAGNGLVAFAP